MAPSRDQIYSIIFTILIGMSAWSWGLYSDLHSRSVVQEKLVAVLEEKKADKAELVEIKTQLATQTAILDGQSKLMEQQFQMLKAINSK